MFEHSKESKVGGGRHRLDQWVYTPLYEKGMKKTENKSMETTKTSQLTSYFEKSCSQLHVNKLLADSFIYMKMWLPSHLTI